MSPTKNRGDYRGIEMNADNTPLGRVFDYIKAEDFSLDDERMRKELDWLLSHPEITHEFTEYESNPHSIAYACIGLQDMDSCLKISLGSYTATFWCDLPEIAFVGEDVTTYIGARYLGAEYVATMMNGGFEIEIKTREVE